MNILQFPGKDEGAQDTLKQIRRGLAMCYCASGVGYLYAVLRMVGPTPSPWGRYQTLSGECRVGLLVKIAPGRNAKVAALQAILKEGGRKVAVAVTFDESWWDLYLRDGGSFEELGTAHSGNEHAAWRLSQWSKSADSAIDANDEGRGE